MLKKMYPITSPHVEALLKEQHDIYLRVFPKRNIWAVRPYTQEEEDRLIVIAKLLTMMIL